MSYHIFFYVQSVYMGDCNETRFFFVIFVMLLKFRKYWKLLGDKMAKFCQNSVRFLPIWSWKSPDTTLSWSVTAIDDSFWVTVAHELHFGFDWIYLYIRVTIISQINFFRGPYPLKSHFLTLKVELYKKIFFRPFNRARENALFPVFF